MYVENVTFLESRVNTKTLTSQKRVLKTGSHIQNLMQMIFTILILQQI